MIGRVLRRLFRRRAPAPAWLRVVGLTMAAQEARRRWR